MKGLKIVLRERAIEDLEAIWLYTFERWSLEQADRYYDLIYKEMQYLSKKPEAGKNLSDLKEGYRSAKIKSHLIFYRYSTSEIEVIRILHENMDIPGRLDD